jgi:hypothetical protein
MITRNIVNPSYVQIESLESSTQLTKMESLVPKGPAGFIAYFSETRSAASLREACPGKSLYLNSQ